MQFSQRFMAIGFSLCVVLSGFATAATPVAAQAALRGDCSSNQNISEVHRHINGAISQLNHDDRDYGGHRANAVNDLVAARGQLDAAREYAINNDHDNPACFRAFGWNGGDANPFLRGQGGSNRNISAVRRWTETMIDQLQRDQRDYDGHRVAAIADLQRARGEMLAAEEYARAHGY